MSLFFFISFFCYQLFFDSVYVLFDGIFGSADDICDFSVRIALEVKEDDFLFVVRKRVDKVEELFLML